MTKITKTKARTTNRTEDHAAMLKEALARPGVQELMEVYQGWAEINQKYELYRSVTSEKVKIITTDRSDFFMTPSDK